MLGAKSAEGIDAQEMMTIIFGAVMLDQDKAPEVIKAVTQLIKSMTIGPDTYCLASRFTVVVPGLGLNGNWD